MLIKRIIEENFNHYKKPSMLVAFPKCSFKCGEGLCQNSPLALSTTIDISYTAIVQLYMHNSLTNAIVFAGLEPFDSFGDMIELIAEIRKNTLDDIVIYSGYNKNEIDFQINYLHNSFSNIIVKFGRYIPNQEKHFDELLGMDLANDEQYAERIC